MTSVPPPSALTARAVLFGPREDAVNRLTQTLDDAGAVAQFGEALVRLSSTARRVACHRLAQTATDLADVNLGDVVVAGWQKYTTLTDAARRTLDRPGTEEFVDLLSHRISSVHHPQIDVFVDDVLIGSLQFELRLDVVVRAFVATVREGRLIAVEGGTCRLTASLSWQETTIAAQEAELELGALLDLGAGVPLVAAQRHAAV